MAKNRLGDIPGARFHVGPIANNSVASNGGNARIGQVGPFSFDVRVKSVVWTPIGSAHTVSTATSTATYRRMSVYNGGTAGTASASSNRLASLDLTDSVPQYGAAAFEVNDDHVVKAGEIVYFSQETVGGTDANATVLPAGQLQVEYEVR